MKFAELIEYIPLISLNNIVHKIIQNNKYVCFILCVHALVEYYYNFYRRHLKNNNFDK